MDIEFKQKRGFSERSYLLKEDRIIVKTKSLTRILNYEVRLDKIGFDKNFQADNPFVGKILFWVFITIPFVFMIAKFLGAKIDNSIIVINSILFFFLAFLNFIKQHQDDIFLTGGETNLSFYRKYPDENAVLDFIEKIISASKKFQKNKLLDPILNLHPDSYIARTHWLKDNNIIGESEFNQLISEYETQRLL